MAEEGRTKKVIRNTSFNIAFKLLDTLLAFVLRTVFIQTLGISYLGLTGLFTNILTILSLMDLGVGSAVVFSLYKPLAEQDHEKVASLMKLLRKVYTVIGVLVCLAGFGLTPFIPYIVNLPENVDNLKEIYWLTIANTAMTYFLSYRRSLLIADQCSYINSKNLIFFKISRTVVLSIILLVYRNFILYLLLDVANTLVSNLHITYVVKKRYKHLPTDPKPIPKDEMWQIVKYMLAGILNKIGQALVTSTDSILISIFIGTTLVGVYSNYNMIFSGLDVMIYYIFSGLTASIGNFAVQKSGKEAESLFNKIHLINYLIVSVIVVCIYSLSSPFITLWVGSDFILSKFTVLIISLNFYLTAMCNSVGNFINADGKLTYANRFRAFIEGVINIIVSVILVKYTPLGLTGVFLGTTICYICGRVWMDPFILYKKMFSKSLFPFFLKCLFYIIVTIIMAFICDVMTQSVFEWLGLNVFTWLLCAVMCCVVCFAILLPIFKKNKDFVSLTEILRHRILKKKNG